MPAFRLWFLALLCAALLLPAPVHADDADADEGEEVQLEVASDDKAKELEAALKKASKKKKQSDIMPVLDSIEGLRHESFKKPLLKMMTHADGNVATRATALLEERRFGGKNEPDEVDEKLINSMWKNGIKHKSNAKRYPVRAIVYRTYGKAGITLDKTEYKELERDWRWMIGNPQPHFADALIAMCEYFEVTKDKRHCRKLAEELDEPIATNPNSPSNPPAEWWERRWKMWSPMKPAVVSALGAITGQEFDTTEEAKAWFEANEKTFGFKW